MRISGITIPDNAHIDVGLTSIYGIGRTRAKEALAKAGISPVKKAKELSETEENAIRKIIEGYKTEGDLKREISGNIKRLKDAGTYRGMRHSRHLPVRGQRTKTNSRTVRPYVGRKTMGSGRRTVEKK